MVGYSEPYVSLLQALSLVGAQTVGIPVSSAWSFAKLLDNVLYG